MSDYNLLIVDDDEEIIELVRIYLKDLPQIRTFFAHNPEQGTKVILDNKIHCVVSDIAMGATNGQEFIEVIKSLRPKTKIIVYSSYSDVLRNHPSVSKADAVVSKSVTRKEFCSQVVKVLKKVI